MCGKSRRQRQAEAAALSAAVASLNNQIHPAIRNMESASPQTRGSIQSLPQDNPPPYPYSEKQPVLGSKQETLGSSYEAVAQEWLSAGQQQGRKPLFNSYHSFDTRAATATIQDPRRAIGGPVQGGQVAAPAVNGGILGWLFPRQQNNSRKGRCGRSRYCTAQQARPVGSRL